MKHDLERRLDQLLIDEEECARVYVQALQSLRDILPDLRALLSPEDYSRVWPRIIHAVEAGRTYSRINRNLVGLAIEAASRRTGSPIAGRTF